MVGNAVVLNFSGGETSPRSRGRFDQPWYQTSAEKLLNFIPELQGPARFRPGFEFVRFTRRGQVARIFTFQLSNLRSYELEFTPGYMRAYVNGDLLSQVSTTLTGVTNANPGVITVARTTNLNNGDEVIISGVQGMPQINGRQFVLAGNSGATFQLTDPVTGANVDTTGWGVWTSGGTVKKTYEVASPYAAADLPDIQFTSNGAVAYLVHPGYAPRKLTVDSGNNFTIVTFTRVADPFTAGAALTVGTGSFGVLRTGHSDGGITVPTGQGTVVYFAAGSVIQFRNGQYTFSGVLGTTQINGTPYLLLDPNTILYWAANPLPTGGSLNLGPPAILANLDGSLVDSTTWSAYTSGGTATPGPEAPLAAGFYEGRLFYFGTNFRPDCIFGSRSPDASGNQRYDDFTGGAAADNAVFFQFAPVGGVTSRITWGQGGPDYLFVGTYGGPFRVSGSGMDTPITPSSINVRQFDTAGCEAAQAAGLAQIFFVQRGGSTMRSVKIINPYLATFESADLCLNAEQIGYSPLQRVVLARGRPDTLWSFREDGVLVSMSVRITVQEADTLTGWARHELGGGGKVQDLAINPRQTSIDQLWAVVQRTVNGVTYCAVEVMADDVYFPDPEDFFGTGANEAADFANWRAAVYRAQEDYVHMDAALAYDGSARGVAAGATLTPSAVGAVQVEGQAPTTVTLTASAAVFNSGDVGAEIWVKPNAQTGQGAGRATITAYTDSRHVTVTVTVPFSSTAAVAAGDWYFAVSTFYGFAHLEGAAVAAVGDGAVISDGGQTGDADFPTLTVSKGTITLPAGDLGQPQRAAMFRAGLPYLGFIKTHNLEMGGRLGPAQAKPRNISRIDARFMNSLGVEYGTDLYDLDQIPFRLSDATFDRPAPVFSGIKRVNLDDSWSGIDDTSREKTVFICQRLPLPAVVESLDLSYATADAAEGNDE